MDHYTLIGASGGIYCLIAACVPDIIVNWKESRAIFMQVGNFLDYPICYRVKPKAMFVHVICKKKLSTIPISVCTCRGTDLARWCLIFFKRHLINTLSAEIQIGEGSARLWWEVTPNAATLCCDRLRPLRHRIQPRQLKWGWWGEFNYLEMKWDNWLRMLYQGFAAFYIEIKIKVK